MVVIGVPYTTKRSDKQRVLHATFSNGLVELFGKDCIECDRHVQDWRGLAYEVERDRWEYLCPDCAKEREYLDERAIDDMEYPECGNVHDVERVGLHDIDGRRRSVGL